MLYFLVLISTHSYSLTKNEKDFFQAIKDDDIVAFKKLLDAGIDINLQNRDYGYTALILATLNGRTGIAKELINKGAGVNIQKANGLTALMYAAASGHTEIVKEFLNNGAEINFHDKDGRTALDYAKEEKHKEIVNLLSERKI